jgi:peptidoglycan/xylan/chitin deacetylase (PgdA/CDA1 family)
MISMRASALLYHDVVSGGRYETSGFQGADADIYKLDREEFRRHLRRIASTSGLSPVAVSAVDPASSARHFFLTFDDGGASAVDIASILDEYAWPGHFFVTAGRIGTAGFLNKSEIRALHGHGHVVGSHSTTHPLRMGALPAAQLDREWRDSVARLQDILGAPVTAASIPGGYYTRAVAAAASAAGIRALFTSEPITRTSYVEECLVIGRFSVQQGVSEQWVAAILANRPLPRARRYAAWNGKKLLKAAGGPAWLSFRKSLLAWRARWGGMESCGGLAARPSLTPDRRHR